MTTRTRKRQKKYFTLAEANAMLPYVRVILRDITELATTLRERSERIKKLQGPGGIDRAHREELDNLLEESERDQNKMREYEDELKKLNVELKDYFQGLIDFPCWMDDREVYLCWKLGEDRVAHWHELDAGFSGRKKIAP